MNWNAFGDCNCKFDFGIDCFNHGGLCESRRNKHHGNVRTSSLHRFSYGPKDWKGLAIDLNALAGLARVDSANDVGAALEHALGVLHTFGSSHTLDDDF